MEARVDCLMATIIPISGADAAINNSWNCVLLLHQPFSSFIFEPQLQRFNCSVYLCIISDASRRFGIQVLKIQIMTF